MAFFSRFRAYGAALPAPLAAAGAMIAASLFFAALSAFVRYLGQSLHPFEVAFFRSLAGLGFMLPWLVRHGFIGMRTNRLWLYSWRCLFGLIAMLCNFTSLALLPFEQAVALSFTTPLFSTMGAALILGETVRIRRWAATIIGFLGVLIMLRSGAQGPPTLSLSLSGQGLGVALGIAAAMFSAVTTLIVKNLANTEPSDAVVTYMVLLLTPMSLLPALPVWEWPAWPLWPFIAAMGVFGSLGHMCFMRAFAWSDASAVMPYDYTRLLFAAVIGYFAFSEAPDLWTWAGAAVIACSTIYIAHRETLAKSHRGAPLP